MNTYLCDIVDFKCTQCGREISRETKLPFRARCRKGGPIPEQPVTKEMLEQSDRNQASMTQKVKNASVAAVKWVAAGRPIRSDERIKELFSICQECPEFKKRKNTEDGSCRLCGCPIKQNGVRNKLMMATEECPIGKWKADV